MNLKKFLMYSIPFFSIIILTNCSNNDPVVSVASDSENPITTASLSNEKLMDVAWTGGWYGNLWAITQRNAGTSDYYLAKFNFTSLDWDIKYSHYGVRCAVSENGRCYHVNSSGQIWWVTGDGPGTWLSRPENNTLLARDIAIGNFDGGERLWVVFQEPSPSMVIHVYYGDYSGSGNSVAWTNDDCNYCPTTGYMERISTDPSAGAFACGSTSWGTLWYLDPEFNSYEDYSVVDDVAYFETDYATIINSKLWSGSWIGMQLEPTNITAQRSVGMTNVFGMRYIMYLDSQDYLQFVQWNSLH